MRSLLPLLGLFATLGCAPSLEAPQLSTHRLRVDGQRLLDEHGREVLLRGYNAGNRAKMPPYLPFEAADTDADAYFARLAALGANLVRLTFSWEALEPERGTYRRDALDQYRTLLDAARARGLFVIVDFHQDVFASPFCGDGFPLWAIGPDIPHGPPRYDCGFPDWSFPVFDPTSDVSRAFDRLWNNTDGLQDDLEAMWRHVATEYAAHPAVAGFEIINEPGPGSVPRQTFEAETLPRFYARMGGAIREQAGDFPIFGGGRTGDSSGEPNHLTQPALTGFVYAPHFYDTEASLGLRSNSKAALAAKLRTLFEPATRWNTPVLLGEFGAQNTYEHKAEHLRLLYELLDLHRAHAALWDASQTSTHWNTEDFSVLTAGGEEQPWAHATVRAYPRAVAGQVRRFSFDANTARFELEVTGATAGITEVYLPPRHFGEAPRVSASEGVRHRFDTAKSVLLLQAPEGADYTVTVNP